MLTPLWQCTLVAAQILPYRPEPWVYLAKLYREAKDDTLTCFSYASAALAQGPPQKSALFLRTYVGPSQQSPVLCTRMGRPF
jgi:hypothetical protein